MSNTSTVTIPIVDNSTNNIINGFSIFLLLVLIVLIIIYYFNFGTAGTIQNFSMTAGPTGASGGSLIANWTPVTSANVTGYIISYSTNSSLATPSTVTVNGNSVSTSTITGLPAGSYYGQIATRTSSGSSISSSIFGPVSITLSSVQPTSNQVVYDANGNPIYINSSSTTVNTTSTSLTSRRFTLSPLNTNLYLVNNGGNPQISSVTTNSVMIINFTNDAIRTGSIRSVTGGSSSFLYVPNPSNNTSRVSFNGGPGHLWQFIPSSSNGSSTISTTSTGIGTSTSGLVNTGTYLVQWVNPENSTERLYLHNDGINTTSSVNLSTLNSSSRARLLWTLRLV